MRLHNRQIKGSFWSDPDLIYELNRDQRMFFIGLTQLAEDSGCLEYDPRSFKIILYPADNDINPEALVEWTEKIIKMGKLIVYEVEGKKYLYIKNFPKHQSLRTPAPPEIPLPIWICWKPREGSSRYGMYVYESSNNYVATPTYPCSNSNIAIKEENRIEENRIEENRIEENRIEEYPELSHEISGTPFIDLPKIGSVSQPDKVHTVTEEDIAQYQEVYPNVDVKAELKKMKLWLDANPSKRKKNVKSFIARWLAKEQDKPQPKRKKTFEEIKAEMIERYGDI
jgi:hypothetical protein